MRQHHEDFITAGARVVAVSQGTSEQTRAFCDSQYVPFPCLSDPGRTAYGAFGIGRGAFFAVLGPKIIFKGFRAAAHGHFVGKIVGDEFQLAGTFVVDKGTVRFSYYSRDAADVPPNDILLAEIKKLNSLSPGGRGQGPLGANPP